jgi:ubiquinone/menaquinone biosynthesis C-methylase UbiE
MKNTGTPLSVNNFIQQNIQEREHAFVTRALTLLSISAQASILDLGCGTGDSVRYYFNRGYTNIYGIEYEKKCVDNSNKLHPYLKISQGDAENLSQFPALFFDVVYSWHVLEHLPNPDQSASEVHRVLKKGGYFIVGVPNGRHLDDRIVRLLQRIFYGRTDHLQVFDSLSIENLLINSGFQIELKDFGFESLNFIKDHRFPFHWFNINVLFPMVAKFYQQVYHIKIIAKKLDD